MHKLFVYLKTKSLNREKLYYYNISQISIPFRSLRRVVILTEIRFINCLILNLKLNYLNTIVFPYKENSTKTKNKFDVR